MDGRDITPLAPVYPVRPARKPATRRRETPERAGNTGDDNRRRRDRERPPGSPPRLDEYA